MGNFSGDGTAKLCEKRTGRFGPFWLALWAGLPVVVANRVPYLDQHRRNKPAPRPELTALKIWDLTILRLSSDSRGHEGHEGHPKRRFMC